MPTADSADARLVAGGFGVPEDIAERLVDQLFRDLSQLLVPAATARMASIERVLLAGRAQAKMLQSVLQVPGVDEPARRRILAIRNRVVPDATGAR